MAMNIVNGGTMRAEILFFFREYADVFWLTEIGIIAAAWTVLCHVGSFRAQELWRSGRRFGVFFLLLSVVNLAAAGVRSFIPAVTFQLLWGIGHGIAALLYVRLCSPYQPKTNLLLWSALYTEILALAAIAGQSSYLFGTFVRRGAAEGVVRCIIHLLMPMAALYLRRFNFDEYRIVPISALKMLSADMVSVLIYYFIENFMFLASIQVVVLLLVSYVCMLIIAFMAVGIMYTVCAEHSSLIDLQAERQRILSEREMTRIMEGTLEDLRCIRHDLKNQYAYMQILLSEKRYDELKAYFCNLAENLPNQLNFIDCGNSTVNTVLNMELGKLKTERICVERNLAVPPILPFADEDVCALLANLLDNAIEECRRLLGKGAKEAAIRIEIYPHQSYLLIKCGNSTDRMSLNRLKVGLRTTKNDQYLHGYGTRIITNIAEKYNGSADFNIENGRFIARVMLDMGGKIYDD